LPTADSACLAVSACGFAGDCAEGDTAFLLGVTTPVAGFVFKPSLPLVTGVAGILGN